MNARYEARAAAARSGRDEAARRSAWIARLRLATFIPGAGGVLWAITHGGAALPLALGLALLLSFGALVVLHARVEERIAWCEALYLVNMQALARIARAWDGLPPADAPDEDGRPGPTLLEHHPYALDLDLFGRASLMQWIGPAATAPGTATCHRWLLEPAQTAEILDRQHAVAELAAAADWREHFAAHGRLAAGVRTLELAQFLDWAEGPGVFTRSAARVLQLAVLVITVSIWTLIAFHATGVTDPFWSAPLVAGIVLSFFTADRIHREFTRAGNGQRALARYAELFAHATAAPERSAALASIRARLTGSGTGAPESMRLLNRILGFSYLRSGAAILHFPIQAFTLWDFHVFFALERWRTREGRHIRRWMEAVGELDALSAFAQIKADNPAWCFPDVRTAEDRAETTLVAKELGHPLIPDDRRVGNDVVVGPPGTLLLITGSNMSGKSTLLRAIGLNTVLAQAGGPVCAAALRLPPVDLETSIRVQDSLEQGLSYFMAALARLKRVVERSERPQPGRVVLFLLDEILQGTNTAERSVAVRGIARHLLDAGAIGVMTTHDLAVASEEPLKSGARLVHFTESVDAEGRMSFDYRLRPGLATSRNALRLMQLIGITLDDQLRPPAD